MVAAAAVAATVPRSSSRQTETRASTRARAGCVAAAARRRIFLASALAAIPRPAVVLCAPALHPGHTHTRWARPVPPWYVWNNMPDGRPLLLSHGTRGKRPAAASVQTQVAFVGAHSFSSLLPSRLAVATSWSLFRECAKAWRFRRFLGSAYSIGSGAKVWAPQLILFSLARPSCPVHVVHEPALHRTKRTPLPKSKALRRELKPSSVR